MMPAGGGEAGRHRPAVENGTEYIVKNLLCKTVQMSVYTAADAVFRLPETGAVCRIGSARRRRLAAGGFNVFRLPAAAAAIGAANGGHHGFGRAGRMFFSGCLLPIRQPENLSIGTALVAKMPIDKMPNLARSANCDYYRALSNARPGGRRQSARNARLCKHTAKDLIWQNLPNKTS